MSSTPGDGHLDSEHFTRLVRQWSEFGPPLRPSPFDCAVMQQCVDGLPPDAVALVLGLTPEIIGCRWPRGTRLLAADHSPSSVRLVWPQGVPAHAHIMLARWESLPVADASVQLACGDGCPTGIAWPGPMQDFMRSLARVLAPGGRLVARVFIRADRPEPLAQIGEDLRQGRIGSVHALKMRLWSALHGPIAQGLRQSDIWTAWNTLPRPVLGSTGWMEGEVASLDRYRGQDVRYFIPTLAELRDVAAPDFVEQACHFGTYEGAEFCPTLVWQRRA